MMHILKTTLLLSVATGSEKELAIEVHYEGTAGYAASHDEPGCDDTVEVVAVLLDGGEKVSIASGTNVLTLLFDDDVDLIAECLADWCERREDERSAAAEYQADARRDDAMMERFEREGGR